ncbi:MAG TPA: hypothetical protein DEQ64_09025 [Lachnoclostridium sp.]|jgi:hypothetical protein|uniref:hypothetical protein n=1 Tax=Lacrimispora sp. TaxID=2719234 RepID=UPI000EBF5B80|nr:hypothetical protein [Lacrimispora sp.]HCD43859.1 hypothetical protein [Lachnoclostridium sp.]
MNKTSYMEIGGKQYPLRFGIGTAKAMSEKFGSMEKMLESMKDRPENEIIDAMIWMIEALIRQGCAYKNIFEADLPIQDNAPVKEGKYIPLTKEEIEIGMEISNIAQLKELIFSTVISESAPEIKTTPKGKEEKNAGTA